MPGRISDLQDFLELAKAASNATDLRALLVDFVPEQGFDYFAFVDHVDLTRGQRAGVGMSNYPKTWTEMIWARGYFAEDPIHAACQKTSVGFAWSDVPRIIDVTAKQKEILLSAEKEGLGDGFTVPIHVPGEFSASASFGLRYGRTMPQPALPIMQYAGCFSFEAARALSRAQQQNANSETYDATGRTRGDPENKRAVVPVPPELSSRQLDCLVLVAQGKSDWEIAQLLGISEHTVHFHIEAAKKRFSVRTRYQLLVKALYTTKLTFSDIIGNGRNLPN